MIMKHTFATILLAIVTLAIQAQENKFTVSGDFSGMYKDAPYAVKADSLYILNDSTMIIPAGQTQKKYKVTDGRFLISGQVERPIYSSLIVHMDIEFEDGRKDEHGSDFPFILEPGNIVFDSEKLVLRGTPLNDVCAEAKLKFRELVESEQFVELKQYAKDFVNQHAADPAGIYMTLLMEDVLQPKEILKMIKQLSENGQRTMSIGFLEMRLEDQCKTPQEGDLFTDFAVEYDGKTTRLSDFVGRGQYVLVDFWASWCIPCREEIPNIIAAYNRYKDRNFTALGIAAWDKPEATTKAITEEKISYPQIINSQKIATDAYGITGIPEIILFAPDGTIIARGLRGNEIESKLAEIFE